MSFRGFWVSVWISSVDLHLLVSGRFNEEKGARVLTSNWNRVETIGINVSVMDGENCETIFLIASKIMAL